MGEISYKIGITGRDPKKRVKELQTGTPNDLNILYTFETKYGNLLEVTLHRHYNIDNIRGEWFTLSNEEINNFLNECYKIENNFKTLHDESPYFQSILNKTKRMN